MGDYLDGMITGNQYLTSFERDKNGKKLIEQLFEYQMTQKKNAKLNKYIYECFDAFVKNKECLVLDFTYLSFAKDYMHQMIVHGIKRNHVPKDENDKTNLIRSELVSIF